MNVIRSKWWCAPAVAIAVAAASLSSGCGSDSPGGAPASLDPVIEKKTQDMLKNKSQQYNERYRKNGGKPG